jgi:hypothetical protein
MTYQLSMLLCGLAVSTGWVDSQKIAFAYSVTILAEGQ